MEKIHHKHQILEVQIFILVSIILTRRAHVYFANIIMVDFYSDTYLLKEDMILQLTKKINKKSTF